MPEDPAIQSSSGAGKTVGRIVLYTVLAALLGLGIWEFMAKQSATSVGKSWDEKFAAAKKDSKDLYFKDLPKDNCPDPGKPESLGNGRFRITYQFGGLLAGIIGYHELKVEVECAKTKDGLKPVEEGRVTLIKGPGVEGEDE